MGVNVTQFFIHGELKDVKNLQRVGLQQMDILKNQMSFNALQQGRRVFTLPDGVSVVCVSTFGLNAIHMYAPPVEGKKVEVEKDLFRVIRNTPAQGAQHVLVNSDIIVSFNKSVKADTLSSDTFYVRTLEGDDISGVIVYNAQEYKAIFTPDENLPEQMAFVVSLTGNIMSSEGDNLQPYRWRFSTGDALLIVEVSPSDGETDVLVDSIITASFNRNVNYNTIDNLSFFVVDELGVDIDGELVYDATTFTIEFTPTSSLDNDMIYTVVVTGAIVDDQGIGLTKDYEWDFITEEAVTEAVMYIQIYDINAETDYIKYVGLDSSLNIIPTLIETIPEPCTSLTAALTKSSVTTRTVDSWGVPFVYVTQQIGNQKAWYFTVINNEHDDVVDKLFIDGNLVKEATYSVTQIGHSRYLPSPGYILTDIGAPEPDPPATNDTNFPPLSLGTLSSSYNGTQLGWGRSENAGWVDTEHYIYFMENRVWVPDGTANYSKYHTKDYIVVNGIETLVHESDNATDIGYRENWVGYILAPPEDIGSGGNWWNWLEGGAIYEIGGVYHYIIAVASFTYETGIEHAEVVDVYYSDGTTLTRKTFPISDVDWNEVPFTTIDEVDYYVNWGPAITIAL